MKVSKSSSRSGTLGVGVAGVAGGAGVAVGLGICIGGLCNGGLAADNNGLGDSGSLGLPPLS